jgi:hypothetical protein
MMLAASYLATLYFNDAPAGWGIVLSRRRRGVFAGLR